MKKPQNGTAKRQNKVVEGRNIVWGVCFYHGHGVPRDYAEAVKWYRRAAEQGGRGAQYRLGVCFYHGHGVPEDHAEAVKWFRKAAKKGESNALFQMGLCCYHGQGAAGNKDEAEKWFRWAAERGNEKAREMLKEMNPPAEDPAQATSE